MRGARFLAIGLLVGFCSLNAGFVAAQQGAGAEAGNDGPPPTFLDQKYVQLHALDKIAARVSQMQVAVGDEARFGRLSIRVLACRMRPPEEPPESAAFLEIVDAGRDSQPVEAFRGWMFASSPSLSAMEHPLYDIWVARCMTASEAETAAMLAKTGGVEDMGEDEGAKSARPPSSPPVPYKPTSQR